MLLLLHDITLHNIILHTHKHKMLFVFQHSLDARLHHQASSAAVSAETETHGERKRETRDREIEREEKETGGYSIMTVHENSRAFLACQNYCNSIIFKVVVIVVICRLSGGRVTGAAT